MGALGVYAERPLRPESASWSASASENLNLVLPTRVVRA